MTDPDARPGSHATARITGSLFAAWVAVSGACLIAGALGPAAVGPGFEEYRPGAATWVMWAIVVCGVILVARVRRLHPVARMLCAYVGGLLAFLSLVFFGLSATFPVQDGPQPVPGWGTALGVVGYLSANVMAPVALLIAARDTGARRLAAARRS